MTQTTNLEPVKKENRIAIIDALRGFALLGILIMNLPYFAMPFQMANNPFVNGETGLNYRLWWLEAVIFEGAMRGMFSMLFGAGTVLLLSRLEKRTPGLEPADIYFRRTIWLVIFGMINAFILTWPGDILFTYGICGLFLFAFRQTKSVWLLVLVVVCLSIGSGTQTGKWYGAKETRKKGEKAMVAKQKGQELNKEATQNLKEWEKLKKELDWKEQRLNAAKTKEGMSKGYFHIIGKLAEYNIKSESISLYKAYFWDAIAFMFVGIVLFRMGYLSGSFAGHWYLLVAVLTLSTGMAMGRHHVNTQINLGMDFTLYADTFLVSLYQVRRLCLSVGHLSLILFLFKTGWFSWPLKWLENVGRMAFSNYLMQSIICSQVFYGFGLGYYGAWERYQIYIFMLGFWAFQMVFSYVWLRYFAIGPLEWLWRSLTYGKKQALLKA